MKGNISVIVPVYNVEKYLERCVNSIINQTYDNIEVILVDDGSTDNCPRICDELSKSDDRIKVIHKSNGGLSDARNAGIRAANGNYYAFVDSDDYIESDMLDKMYREIRKHNADLVICGIHRRYDDGGEFDFFCPIKDEILNGTEVAGLLYGLNGWSYISVWNKLYKKELFNEIKFPVGKIHEDEFIIHKILNIASKIVTISYPAYIYIDRKDSIMNTKINIKRLDVIEALYERKKFYNEIGNNQFDNDIRISAYKIYTRFRNKIQASNSKQKKRMNSIDAMFLEIYYGHNNSISRKIYCCFPRLFSTVRLLIHRKNKMITFIKCYIRNSNKDIVLVDTPQHGNLGDQAIALSSYNMLNKSKRNKVGELTAKEFDLLGKMSGLGMRKNAKIIVQGGGFMGDLWPEEEIRIREIVKLFRNHQMLFFPQTVSYHRDNLSSDLFKNEGMKLLNTVDNIYFLAREKNTFRLMNDYLGAEKCCLVPDVVIMLNYQKCVEKRSGVALCLRKDKERVLSKDEYGNIVKALQEVFSGEMIHEISTVLDKKITRKYRESEVANKLNEFASYRMIVTDRLHGMLFAAITRTPCIVFDNFSGKVSGMYEFIKCNKYIRMADKEDSIGNLANDVLNEDNSEFQYDTGYVDIIKRIMSRTGYE